MPNHATLLIKKLIHTAKALFFSLSPYADSIARNKEAAKTKTAHEKLTAKGPDLMPPTYRAYKGPSRELAKINMPLIRYKAFKSLFS